MCWDDLEEDDQDELIINFINLPDDAPAFIKRLLLTELNENNWVSDVLRRQALDILNKENNTRPEIPLIREPKRLFEYTEQNMYEKFRFTHQEVMIVLYCMRYKLIYLITILFKYRFGIWSEPWGYQIRSSLRVDGLTKKKSW